MDAQWSDDFHHSRPYFVDPRKQAVLLPDFVGVEPLVATLREGWYYSGQYSNYRKRAPWELAARAFAVTICGMQPEPRSGGESCRRRTAYQPCEFRGAEASRRQSLCSPLFVPCCSWAKNTARLPHFNTSQVMEIPNWSRRCAAGGARSLQLLAGNRSVPDPQAEQTFSRSEPRSFPRRKRAASHPVALLPATHPHS